MADKQINTVTHLIATNRDSGGIYDTAAGHISSPELKTLFTDYGTQRANFATELERCLPATKEVSANVEGTIGGTLHKGWIAFREGINYEDVIAVLPELIRADEYAIDQYEKALKAEIPMETVQIAQRQLADIRAAADRLRAINADPNKTDRGPIPGIHSNATGTTAAGRAPVPDKQGVTRS